MEAKAATWVCSTLAIACLWIAALGQSVPVDSAPTKQSTQVSLPAFVSDSDGKPASGMTQADLSIVDNKQPVQSVLAVRLAKDAPLRLGVLIDSSNSERSNGLYTPGLHAAWNFMNQVLTGPEDKVLVVNFNTVPEATEFMNKSALLKFKMDVTPSGGTALFDAIFVACKKRIEPDLARPARHVLVILSDGADNQSRVSKEQAVAAAQQTGTVIFAVSTNEDQPYGFHPGSTQLRELAEKTGGQSFLYLRGKDMPKVFSEIREQIENMWLLTYVPADTGRVGEYRSVEVKGASDKKLKVRAPKGYYVAPPR